MTKLYYTQDGRAVPFNEIFPKAASEPTLPEGITKHDISTESWREYVYDDETSYYIDNPRTLYINHKSDVISHRVVDMDGVTHYPCPSWIALRWHADPEVSF